MKTIKKVLILGSGALKIGEAGEFDYSGSQAVKALKEEGIKTVLVNPNIATIQTSKLLADTVYFLPVTPYFVEKVVENEKPDGILLSFGGQTALNCGLKLYDSGVLNKYGVTVLGTPVSSIELTEDRQKFATHLRKIYIPTPQSVAVTSVKAAFNVARSIGYPVMIRAGFALGGQGSGIAKTEKELAAIAEKALSFTPQILVEQYLHHFKEIEYEVVRDSYDNCITVCNMENMDPLGIHTGDSIVVAPSQTLTNYEYHFLRSKSIEIVRSLGIVGECNVQFALNPNPENSEQLRKSENQQFRKSDNQKVRLTDTPSIPSFPNLDYYVIEVNARLSRSSALASKATGYPLAYVAAKLALNKNLTTIKNKVTDVTQSCFEPALDYIVVKIPRWDIEKFRGADERIGSSMKSVGEVMGIGRTFEEAYQKAIRMLDLDFEGATSKLLLKADENAKTLLEKPTPKRMFAISQALKEGITINTIYSLTGIDPWFLYRIKNIVDEEKAVQELYSSREGVKRLNREVKVTDKQSLLSRKLESRSRLANARSNNNLTKDYLLRLKQLGFSDKRIGDLLGVKGLEIRSLRKKWGITPSVFQIDTLAGEFPAKTNYLYLTYNGNHHDVNPLKKQGVIVLGSGPYRIGSSVEFDWTSVNTVRKLADHKKDSIIINSNPETVSTDFDVSERLYFEELTFERIADIYDFENPYGVILSVGGQTPNNRARALKVYGANILGTDPDAIDTAEDRSRFSKLLDDLGVIQPPWNKFADITQALAFAESVGFPVLVRPSYVLSGTLMRICHNKEELRELLSDPRLVSKEFPITVSKFIEEAKEIELDAVASSGNVLAHVITEHIENAGVHSGDASIMLPPQKLNVQTKKEIKEVASKLAKALHISGPFNIQFLAKDDKISVIEINLRASRTFPFISKATGIDFINLAVDAFFGKTTPTSQIKSLDPARLNFVAVKVPQFSFARLTGADPILHVEMASTGEVACFGDDLEEAFLKGELSVGGKIPQKGIFISLGGTDNKERFLDSARLVSTLRLPIFATEKTAAFLQKHGIYAKTLYKIYEEKSPNILEYFQKGNVDLTINLVDPASPKDESDHYTIRRAAIDFNIPIYTNLQKAKLFVRATTQKRLENLLIKPWSAYTIDYTFP